MTCHINIYFTLVLDGESYIVYSNNGTAQNGVGSYIVQYLTTKW